MTNFYDILRLCLAVIIYNFLMDHEQGTHDWICSHISDRKSQQDIMFENITITKYSFILSTYLPHISNITHTEIMYLNVRINVIILYENMQSKLLFHDLSLYSDHDDVIKRKHFPRYWPFVRGIHRSPVNSPHKGQLCGALMFTLICERINAWVNNREAGDLKRYRPHYDVIIMDDVIDM